MPYTIRDFRVNSLPSTPVPNSRYYVPNGNGTDLDEYLTDLTGAYRFVGSAPVVITNGWELTGNTIIGSEYLGTNNNFPLNFYTNGLNTLELSNVPAQLYLKSGANPLFSMKQDITNHEFQIRLGDGNGILNSNWNVYEPIVDKIRFGLSSHTFIIGDILSPYSSSSLYVSSTSSAGANIDAQPNGINSDEANIEAMKSDYSNGEGVAMRVWGATGVVDTMMGYNKQNLGALEFNNITNLINVKTNAALRIGTNNTERITILGNGNIGLNEISPTEILHVNGTPRFVTGNEGLSKVWTSDANGVGDWVTPASPSTPTLQQVTDVGNTTTNDIVVADNRVIIFNDAGFGNIELTDAATVLASYNTSGIQYRVGSFYQSFESAASTINNISNTLPDISGILVLSVNGNTADSSGEITLPVGLGTVTSVDMNVPTGFAISGNPITTSGTLALAFDTGYSLPTDASQADWDTAFGWGDWSTGVNKTFVDALNVDADTLDGIDSTGFALVAHTHTLSTGATDVTATATELNLLDLSGLTAGWILSADTATTASWKAPTVGTSYTDEEAQDAVGNILIDSSEIDFTYDDGTPSITASLITGSIDVLKLDSGVQTSLGLADNSLQSGDNVSELVNDSGYMTSGSQRLRFRQKWELYEEFLGYNLPKDVWFYSTSGAGSSAGTTGVLMADIDTTFQGATISSTGTTTTGKALVYYGNGTSANTGMFRGTNTQISVFETKVRFKDLSNGTDAYTALFGYTDWWASAFYQMGIKFVYDEATYGDFWVLRADDGTTSAVVTTTPVAALTNYILRIEIDNFTLGSAGGSVRAYINDVEIVASSGTYPIVTNINTTNTLYPSYWIQKTAGTNNRSMFLDWVYQYAEFITR